MPPRASGIRASLRGAHFGFVLLGLGLGLGLGLFCSFVRLGLSFFAFGSRLSFGLIVCSFVFGPGPGPGLGLAWELVVCGLRP